MRTLRLRDPIALLTAVVLLALPALAWVQARWLQDVRTTTRERLDRAAQNAAAGVARDLEFELGRVMPWVSPLTAPEAPAGRSGIGASDIFIVDAPGEWASRVRFREWARDAQSCPERPWPPDLDSLRGIAERHYSVRPRPRLVELAAVLDRVTSTHIVYAIPLAGGSLSPPTIVPPCSPAGDALLLVRVDLQAIRGSLLPMLIERHFGDSHTTEFNVVVVERGHAEAIVARGPGAFDPGEVAAAPDLSVPLFILRADEPGTRDARNSSDSDTEDGRAGWRRTLSDRAGGWRATVEKAPWTLVARHHAGSLDAAVARIYAWNLALAVGVLLVLACAVVAMAVSARRATRLSQQQVEFVAAVSHELRSPVAAIDLAAQNLGAGVVTDPARLRKYGDAIRAEARRLGATVERVLQFASINSGQVSLVRVPVALATLIETVAARARAQWPDASIDVCCDLPDDATLLGDRASLESCVENLVSNAAKYAGPSAHVLVQAGTDGAAGAQRVWVRVEDNGPGIAPEDRPHLFEPFRRGTHAIERRIPGNGLGLYVVKHLVEAHGGRVEVDATRRSGAAFTLWLPVHHAAEWPLRDLADGRSAT